MKGDVMKILVMLAWVLCGCLVGCSKQSISVSERESAPVASQQAASVPQPVQAKSGATKVAKIVFVGKEKACDCTRKAINASWTALQTALGAPAKIPVEQLKVDTESAEVESYEKQKAIMALPAIYFLDEKGSAVETLQGEVTADQIKTALQR